MTRLDAHDAPPLRTDADVLARVEHLIGPAAANRQLWILFVDGDDRQTPVVMPISDLPRRAQHAPLGNLAQILRGLRSDLATARGPGSVIFVFERKGVDEILPTDRDWARALAETSERADLSLRGTFLSTPNGVRALV